MFGLEGEFLKSRSILCGMYSYIMVLGEGGEKERRGKEKEFLKAGQQF